MGTDNLHHKRKAKTTKDLQRNKAKRAPYAYILIVCEGTKTEPLYLRDLIHDLKLNTANVEVCGRECGSSPQNVFNYANERQIQAKKVDDPFDFVFCVFDKDKHETFDSTMTQIAKLSEFKAVVSVPCFEFWLLLHFHYTTKPYAASGAKSICEAVIEDLKKFMPDYEKGVELVYSKTKDLTDLAIKSADSVLHAAVRNYTDNPSTGFHEFVKYLRKLKEV